MILRTRKFFKNSTLHQQIYKNKFLPYLLNEQEKLKKFVILFFKQVYLKVHSFNIIKDQKGNVFYGIRYVYIKKDYNKRNSLKTLVFSSIENSFCVAFQQLGYKKPLSLLFYEITPKKKMPSLVNFFRSFTVFTVLELSKAAQIIKNSEGFASYLADFICEKLESLRTKSDKKLQGRLVLSIEKLLYFLKKNDLNNKRGVKIEITGRVNGLPRSKKKSMAFGTLALQQINLNIDFCYKEAKTVFGCFGVKIWAKYL